MLEISPAIRLPRIDEVPNNSEVLEGIKERENANIVEGFVIHQNTTQDLPFNFYAEINVNNSRLWKVFKNITNDLPEQLSCIYNLYDSEPNYSIYSDKKIILKKLDKFETELTKDCNIEFGLIHQVENSLQEIFISDCKYIKFWGIDEIRFRQIMEINHLNEIKNLNFIDEYPKVIEPLTNFIKNARDTFQVFNELDIFFMNCESDVS
ncbi:hypothetical protein [Flavobacterium aestivum]|uniref:hypothetical protein n=1 Tax=Flavobacterium aestivum TaxID=3003257 RepID=UPI002482F420|nr:hypothetical protein [Flavobacterium aestivum]